MRGPTNQNFQKRWWYCIELFYLQLVTDPSPWVLTCAIKESHLARIGGEHVDHPAGGANNDLGAALQLGDLLRDTGAAWCLGAQQKLGGYNSTYDLSLELTVNTNHPGPSHGFDELSALLSYLQAQFPDEKKVMMLHCSSTRTCSSTWWGSWLSQ